MGGGASVAIMSRLCTLGGEGRLALELIENVGPDRCFVGVSAYGRRLASDVDDEQDGDGFERLELERALVSKSALFGFVDALRAWTELPLERLRTPSFTHEVELARGCPERIGIAVGPLPRAMRYRLGDRVLLKLHTRLGGRSSTLGLVFDVSGAAVFVDQVLDATGARSPFARR